MLAKPVIFTLTFLLAVLNFIFLLIPVAIIGFPLYMFLHSLFLKVGMNLFFFLISRVSLVMIGYIFLDFIFGFTVRRLNKNSIPFKKAKSIEGQEDIIASFEWLKKKFDMPNVKLYMNQSFTEINAYAIGSIGRKYVTITWGLLEDIKAKSANYEQYIDSVQGILGHELSHLANKDYLPGMLASASETANRHVSRLIRWVFVIFANMFRLVPGLGKYVYLLLIGAYNLINYVIMSFFNWVFMPLYNFIKKWFGRSIEYRCDYDSARAVGGRRMARGLSMLGSGGFFTLFSTHPRTKARINNVEHVQPVPGKIRPSFIGGLSNFASVVLVVGVCAYSTYMTNVPEMYQHYLNEVQHPIMQKYDEIRVKLKYGF